MNKMRFNSAVRYSTFLYCSIYTLLSFPFLSLCFSAWCETDDPSTTRCLVSSSPELCPVSPVPIPSLCPNPSPPSPGPDPDPSPYQDSDMPSAEKGAIALLVVGSIVTIGCAVAVFYVSYCQPSVIGYNDSTNDIYTPFTYRIGIAILLLISLILKFTSLGLDRWESFTLDSTKFYLGVASIFIRIHLDESHENHGLSPRMNYGTFCEEIYAPVFLGDTEAKCRTLRATGALTLIMAICTCIIQVVLIIFAIIVTAQVKSLSQLVRKMWKLASITAIFTTSSIVIWCANDIIMRDEKTKQAITVYDDLQLSVSWIIMTTSAGLDILLCYYYYQSTRLNDVCDLDDIDIGNDSSPTASFPFSSSSSSSSESNFITSYRSLREIQADYHQQHQWDAANQSNNNNKQNSPAKPHQSQPQRFWN